MCYSLWYNAPTMLPATVLDDSRGTWKLQNSILVSHLRCSYHLKYIFYNIYSSFAVCCFVLRFQADMPLFLHSF